jgi:hypothetical protein
MDRKPANLLDPSSPNEQRLGPRAPSFAGLQSENCGARLSPVPRLTEIQSSPRFHVPPIEIENYVDELGRCSWIGNSWSGADEAEKPSLTGERLLHCTFRLRHGKPLATPSVISFQIRLT